MSFRRNINRPRMPQSGYHINKFKHNPAKAGYRKGSLLRRVMRLRQQRLHRDAAEARSKMKLLLQNRRNSNAEMKERRLKYEIRVKTMLVKRLRRIVQFAFCCFFVAFILSILDYMNQRERF